MPDQPSKKAPENISLKATAIIGGITLASLLICVPLVEMTRSPLLPIAVFFVSGFSICSVWVWAAIKAHRQAQEAPLHEKVAELEQRLGNVEIINAYEHSRSEVPRGYPGEEREPARRKSESGKA